MSRYTDPEDWKYSQEAREKEFQIIWECPYCSYRYESEPGFNEALPCPECCERPRCVRVGESYR
jgi:hypothetical protein